MLLRSAICLVFLLVLGSGALAEKRIALVIANQGYATEVGPLKNPLKDIRIVGAALAKVGFEMLDPVKDANRDQILYAAHDFADRLSAAGRGNHTRPLIAGSVGWVGTMALTKSNSRRSIVRYHGGLVTHPTRILESDHET